MIVVDSGQMYANSVVSRLIFTQPWSGQSHNFLKEEDKEIQDDAKKTALIETLEKDEDEEADVDIPMVQSADASGQSRLTNEFEVIYRW